MRDKFAIVAPIGINSFCSRVVDFTVIAKDNIFTTRHMNVIISSTANDNAMESTGGNFIASTNIKSYRLDRRRFTRNTVRLLFEIVSNLGYLRMNSLVTRDGTIDFLFVAQVRNNITFGIPVLDITHIAECNHALRHIDLISTFTTEDYHAILGDSIRISLDDIITFVRIDYKFAIGFILIAADCNLVLALTRIHDSKGLESIFTIESLRNINSILARAKVVFAVLEVVGNDLTLQFTMSKLSGICDNRSIFRVRAQGT